MTEESEQQETRIKPRKRLSIAIGSKLIKRIEKYTIRHTLVGNTVFFDPRQFAWSARLEDNWESICVELEDVLRERERIPNFQDITRGQRSQTQDDRWKTFFLYGYGYKTQDNRRRWPQFIQEARRNQNRGSGASKAADRARLRAAPADLD